MACWCVLLCCVCVCLCQIDERPQMAVGDARGGCLWSLPRQGLGSADTLKTNNPCQFAKAPANEPGFLYLCFGSSEALNSSSSSRVPREASRTAVCLSLRQNSVRASSRGWPAANQRSL